MAKPRRLTLLITLVLLLTAATILGHFVADVVCVALGAADDYECAAGQVIDGRPDSTSPITAELHDNFNLPSEFPTLSLIPLTFILAVDTLAYVPYSPPPFPPPPKLLS